MACRRIVFTKNNGTEEDKNALLNDPEFSYIIIGEEIAPTTGTKHLQGYAEFEKQRRYTKLSKKYGMHIEAAKTQKEAIEYCKKDGVFEERGKMKGNHLTGGEMEIERGDCARNNAKLGNFDAVPSDIYIKYRSAIHAIARDHQPQPETLTEMLNEWIGGEPRIGKSYGVRKRFPIFYLKMRNKGWDGYNGEEVVLIEEICPEDENGITSFLKQWVDFYPFRAEMKGDSRMIRPKRIMVTSNYSLEECFHRQIDLEALRQRFKVIHMIKI